MEKLLIQVEIGVGNNKDGMKKLIEDKRIDAPGKTLQY